MRAFILALTLLLSACSAHYGQATQGVRVAALEGNPEGALEALERQSHEHSLDALLLMLDRGILLRQAGRLEESVKTLQEAAALGESRETVRLSDELFGRAPYRMSSIEKQALHAIQALSYVELGQWDEAVVEARITDRHQLALVRGVDPGKERFITGSALDPAWRPYLERLIFGRYVSALAHELAGNPDSAFIDYYEAWQLGGAAPPDAPVSTRALTSMLRRRARELGRCQELKALEATGVAEEEVPPGTGEIVVVVELATVPGRRSTGPGRPVELEPARASRGHTEIRVEGGSRHATAETVSSLEDLLRRRGAQGLILDTERSATIGVNTALVASYVLLFPVMVPVMFKRGYESGVRSLQSWRLLPAELRVGRLRLPEGRHTLRIAQDGQVVTRQVAVRAGRPTLVSVRMGQRP